MNFIFYFFIYLPITNQTHSLVGSNAVHASAERQVTGEAVYTDDIPRMPNELIGSLVLGTKPSAKIVRIDASKALAVPVRTPSPSSSHTNAKLRFSNKKGGSRVLLCQGCTEQRYGRYSTRRRSLRLKGYLISYLI